MQNDFFGKGPAYPFERTGGGNFKIAEGKSLVESCLEHAVLIQTGTRPMYKGLGSNINKIIFSLEGAPRDAIVKEFINEGIKNVEPRVEILDATVTDSDDGSTVFVKVEWSFINQDRPENKVIKVSRGDLS